MKVEICSLADYEKHGGIELYIRELAQRLEYRGLLSGINGSLSRTKPLSEVWAPVINRLLPLMTRPVFCRVARLFAEHFGYQWCRRSLQNATHIHYVGTGWDLLGFALTKYARRRQIPITCLPAVHPETWGDSRLDLDFYKAVDTVFVLSDFESRHLQRHGLSESSIVRTACAPSTAPTGSAQRFQAKHCPNATYVLFVGRKSKEKGYHSLRTAIAGLLRDGHQIRLVSVGREVDPPYPELPTYADIDLGTADEQDKQDALAACDVFALPSEAESFGIVYVEAWSYSKPVICGTAPACRELIERHKGGLVTDGTTSQLFNAIVSFVNEPTLRQILGSQGKSAVDLYYNWESIVQTHESVWRQLRQGNS